jgi:hypothetical protein
VLNYVGLRHTSSLSYRLSIFMSGGVPPVRLGFLKDISHDQAEAQLLTEAQLFVNAASVNVTPNGPAAHPRS